MTKNAHPREVVGFWSLLLCKLMGLLLSFDWRFVFFLIGITNLAFNPEPGHGGWGARLLVALPVWLAGWCHKTLGLTRVAALGRAWPSFGPLQCMKKAPGA